MRRLQVIKLYDVETLQLALCLVAHTGVVMRCMHMEGTDYLVSSGTDGCLIFWGAYTATPRQIIPCDAVFTSLVWDITDRVLYAGSSSGAVYAFHVPEADGDRVEIAEGARLQAHADLIKVLDSFESLPPVVVHCFTGSASEAEVSLLRDISTL